MNRLKNFGILFSLLSLLVAGTIPSLYAQRVDVEFFNSNNGLPQTHINSLFIDHKGFIWLGTREGVCRYDGYEFVNFTFNPSDSLSLCNNYAKAIAEDEDGSLWIATSFGLSRFNRNTGKFTNYFHNSLVPRSIASNIVLNVYVDSFHQVWVLTSGVLHRYDRKTNDFTRFPYFNDFFTRNLDSDTNPIFEDSQHRIWIGTKDGLFLFDNEHQVFKQFRELGETSYRVLSIYQDVNNVFWVGTSKGVKTFEYNNRKVTVIHKYQSALSQVKSQVRCISYSSDSLLWFGLNSGFGSFSLCTGTFHRFSDLYFNNEPVELVNVNAILFDKAGVVWIGSQKGLLKLNPYGNRFKGLSKFPDAKNLFGNNIITAIVEDKSKNLWVGTLGTGLYKCHRFSSKVTSEKISVENYLSGDYVTSLYYSLDDGLLVGTRNGVFYYDERLDKFRNFFDLKEVYVGDVFKENGVNAIVKDANDRFWFGTRTGAHAITPKGLVSFYSKKNDSLSIPGNEVYDILVDKQGKIWLATNSGICVINKNLTRIYIPKVVKGFGTCRTSSAEVFCLTQSKNGLIWAGTANGIAGINTKSNAFIPLSELGNFPRNLINAMEEDEKGRLWISTNRGLFMFNPYVKLFKDYTTVDGLFSNEFNVNASFKSNSNRIYFGSVAGVNYFNPDSLPINLSVPNVCISKIEILDQNSLRTIYPFNLKVLKVNSDVSSITIDFAALDFVKPSRNTFRYQMEGLDNKWVELGNNHAVTFTNLKEGTYFFRVMGANNDQIWNSESENLKIVVVAPFLKSKIAYIIYIAVVLIIVLLYFIHRSRIVRRINKLLFEREQVLEEMEEQKEELETKNKNITDSINYAKRIQDAILPPINKFKDILPDSFILFMPKDIVSGDFYWINETKNKTFVAVVDCTGHGVPGAFMSIIGIELLRNITSVEGDDDAAQILNKLSANIHETFTGSGNVEYSGIKVKDGMDVSFCVIDREYNILQFAGAFSNLYIVRNGKIIEFKGDRFSVGMADDTGHLLFSSYYIPIEPNDMIYMFTDGYVDQFGGMEGKKFKFRRFRYLLLNIHMEPLEVQRQRLKETIMEWRGGLEQVDDILIIGIRADLSCMF